MAVLKPYKTRLADLSWLLDVTDSRQALSESSPIWVRDGLVKSGPPVSQPERHPYCEFNLVLEGKSTTLVEGEEAFRLPGDLLLLGPGVPHFGRIKKFPLRSITVYFLPSVLIEMGPENDGVRILRRFTAKQTLRERLVRLPNSLRDDFKVRFEEMSAEFTQQRFGREVRLRSLLLDLLVLLLRWEEPRGVLVGGEPLCVDWHPIIKALSFLREHYADPVYSKEVARAAGVSESQIKLLFHQALNLSWVKYLQGYRIHRAAALLSEGKLNVTEAALAVGFDSLSHFNDMFRSFMGVTPKNFLHK